jgi:hypothetical protein
MNAMLSVSEFWKRFATGVPLTILWTVLAVTLTVAAAGCSGSDRTGKLERQSIFIAASGVTDNSD